MGIFSLANFIKEKSLTINTVNMVEYGNISLFEDKTNIKYPYVNIDVVNNNVVNNSNKKYTFRIYICDRNEPYLAYNKCELILNELMKNLEVENYTTSYFTLSFKDKINGIFTDIIFESSIDLACLIEENLYGYIILENSDYIKNYLKTEEDGKFEIE